MGKIKSALVDRWKRYTIDMVRMRYGPSIDTNMVERYLDHLLETEMKVPLMYQVNNFRRRVNKIDALAVIESIEKNQFIVGGAASLFVQHNTMPNPFRDFILYYRKKRSGEKKTRDTYERGTPHWARWNNKQGNTKIISNSLYGVLGYARFIFHNIFLAESITRMGRVIISTAACGFENFLADNVCFACEGEVYEYIHNIVTEYREKYSDMDFSMLGVSIDTDQLFTRVMKRCGFVPEPSFQYNVKAILNRLSDDEKILLFYKNNFFEFNRIPMIKEKIMFIIRNIDELKLPDINKIERDDVKDAVNDLWKFYDCFVFYNFPVYDSVRKMAYGTRKAVLYIDTDSNFIALNQWVVQIIHEFFEDQYEQDKKELIFICANIITIFLSIVVDRNLKMYAANCGVTEEWQKYLSMKNEFFFWRILFGDVKKRYIDLQMIQEGKLLNNGTGFPEIKGYDFRKSVTKKYLREFFTDLCMEEILSPEKINMKAILTKINWLKAEIKRSMEAGESMYFKQANVNSPEHYVDPMRISGIKAVMLWNALSPEYAIELPSDVDIIPIRNLATEKNKADFKEKFPDVYARLEREIFNNRNPSIASMALNVIAKPKNDNIPMPDWLLYIMDTQKVINSTIKLINPIMESLGLKVQRPTSNKEFLTNLVDL